MNAKEEFLRHTEGKTVKCAIVHSDMLYDGKLNDFVSANEIILKVGYHGPNLAFFLNKLNYYYDSGYGGQNLFGTIWYTDGTWSDRGEYDGSEWWEHHHCPEIPEILTLYPKEL